MRSLFTLVLFSITASLSYGVEPLLVRDFTYGIELTATTDQNPEYDIGKPIDGKLRNFAADGARYFSELTGGEILAPLELGEIPVRTKTGTWVFENDGGVLEIASPVLT